ncbi:hypothetical protein ES703_54495 [subsurface metagenome]
MIRDELYKKFGPLILEAVVMVVKNEVNILRQKAGLPERTNQQLTNAIENRLGELEEYDWMKEIEP